MNKSKVSNAVSRNHTVEYFDVVDIFDRVVGLAPRHYIHAKDVANALLFLLHNTALQSPVLIT